MILKPLKRSVSASVGLKSMFGLKPKPLTEKKESMVIEAPDVPYVQYAFVGKFGSFGTSDGLFDSPYRPAVDDNYLYIVDLYNHRIQIFEKTAPYSFVGKFGSYGALGTLEGAEDGQFQYPWGVDVDDDYIYVADSYNSRIQIFEKTAPYAFIGKFGTDGSADGQMSYPSEVQIDNDYIYVLDTNNHRVQIFDKDTYVFVGKFGAEGSGDGQFGYSYGMDIDDSYIYIADYENSRICIFNKATYAFVGKFGSAGSGDGQFVADGVTIDDSQIYVADSNYVLDTYYRRVQIFNKATYAFVGKFGSVGSGDGQLGYFAGLVVDNSYIYIADYDNHRVQIFNK